MEHDPKEIVDMVTSFVEGIFPIPLVGNVMCGQCDPRALGSPSFFPAIRLARIAMLPFATKIQLIQSCREAGGHKRPGAILEL